MGVKRETLKSGRVLKALIEQFENDRTEQNLFAVFGCLRDSYIWIPGFMQINDVDAKKFINSAVDDIITTDVGMVFEPDILKNGDNKFYPVFSSVEEMGDYGNRFSKIEKHFFDAMAYSMGKQETVGIVVNAFSIPFIIPKEWFEIVVNMPSQIDEEED